MPGGMGQSGGDGFLRYTSFMNAVPAGAASRPPCALPVILDGLSKPIQTPATRSLVYPMNQTFVPSFVVPVLPPAGLEKTAPTPPCAVPLPPTSFMALTISQASSADITGTRVTSGSHNVSPLLLSTRTIAC